MAIDYAASLYDPIYVARGVEATLMTDITDAEPVTVTVIPKLKGLGVALGRGHTGFGAGQIVDVQSMTPAACVRMYELTAKNVVREDLDGGAIEFKDKTWRIDSHRLKPSPDGDELGGEVYLFLSEPA